MDDKYRVIGPISRGSMQSFGGNRYDPNFQRETTYTAIQDYQPQQLDNAYAMSNQNKSFSEAQASPKSKNQ